MLPSLILIVGLFRSLQAQTCYLPTDSAFFASVNIDYPGLDSTKHYVTLMDYENAKRVYVDFVVNRTDRKYFYNYNQKDSAMTWLRSMYPDLDSLVARTLSGADNTLSNTYSGTGVTYTFTGAIDWSFTPPGAGPNWVPIMNRHYVWPALGQAYWLTNNNVYLTKWRALIQDWISHHTSSSAWTTLDAGVRLWQTWFPTIYYMSGTQEMPYQEYFTIYKSMMQHGAYLEPRANAYIVSNWQEHECSGLLHLALFFPEWNNSTTWKTLSLARLNEHLVNGFKPDGFQSELCPNYQTVSIYANIELLCRQNNIQGFSETGLARIEKGYEVWLNIDMPNGLAPILGDGWLNSEEIFNTYYPHEEWLSAVLFNRPTFKTILCSSDFDWSASMIYGREIYNTFHSLPITDTVLSSNYMPYSRYLMTRSGQGYKDTSSLYGLLDMAEDMGYHSHSDALNVIFSAYGRQLIIDPGSGKDYDAMWENYYRLAPAHNVIILDGNNQGSKNGNYQKHAFADKFDYAKGYTSIGGSIHTRELFFVKGEYWLMRDKITGSPISHLAEQLFHFHKSVPTINNLTKSVFTNYGDTFPNMLIVPVSKESLDVKVEQNGYVFYTDKAAPSYTHENAPIATYTKNKTLPITFESIVYPAPRGQNENVDVSYVPPVSGTVDANINTGAEITIGTNKKDWVCWSDDTGQVLFANGVALKGEVGFFRIHADSVYEISLVGTRLLYHNTFGLAASSEVSFNLKNKVGAITLASAQSVTFYYPGLQSVQVDGTATVPQSQGNGWMSFALTQGTHQITIVSSGRVSQPGDTTSPTTPVLFKGVQKSLSQIELAWHPATHSGGLNGYLIYRDGHWLTGTSDTSIIDCTVDLAAVSSYVYEVSAVSSLGVEGLKSDSLQIKAVDTLSFAINNVQGVNGTMVVVSFNKLVDSASAVNLTNYSMSGLTITEAILDAVQPNRVTLTVSPMVQGASYSLVAGNIDDRSLPAQTLVETTVGFRHDWYNDNLIGWWPLDETYGTTASDWSGNNRTGASGSCTKVQGWHNGALNFDGVSSEVLMASNLSSVVFPFTIALWVKRAGGLAGTLVATDDVSGHYYGSWLQVQANGAVSIYIGNGGTPSASARKTKTSVAVISENIWTHVAAVVNSALDMALYINGIDADGAYAGSATNMVHSSTGRLKLGCQVSAVTPILHYRGDMDDVRIYNRTLSLSELQILAADTSGHTRPEETGKADINELSLTCSPNPFNPVTQIILNTGGQAASVHVFDLSGKKIASFQYRDKPIPWNAAGYASGIYIVKAEIGQLKLLKKAVILK